MADIISHESNFNQVQTSERETIYFPISYLSCYCWRTGKTQKVTMRADITQQDKKNTT